MGFKQESIRVGQRLLVKSTNPLDNNTVSNMGFYGLFLILVMPAIVLSQSDSCGGKLTGRGGRFSTPGFPPDTSNLHCEWMIHVNSGYNVYITFDNFILDFGSECITIRDGGNVNATRLDQICRDKIHKSAKYSYTSKDTELFVSFRPQSYTGFSAKWEAVPDAQHNVSIVNRTCLDEPAVPIITLPLDICISKNSSCKHEVAELSNGKKILCDTKTDGGHWIVFQRRIKDNINFTRNFNDYQWGFGDVDHDFWMGIEYIHRLCPDKTKPCELRIDVQMGGKELYSLFQNFTLTGAWDHYTLHINETPEGDLPNLLEDSNEKAFSTFDTAQDIVHSPCARLNGGGWWYGPNCLTGKLNQEFDGTVSYTEMKLRRRW